MKKVSIHESKLIRGGGVELIVEVTPRPENIRAFGLLLPNGDFVMLSDHVPRDNWETVIDGIDHSQ